MPRVEKFNILGTPGVDCDPSVTKRANAKSTDEINRGRGGLTGVDRDDRN